MQTGRSDPDALAELARAALGEGEEERALPYLAAATASAPSARLWQWKGLLERGLDAHDAALSSFAAAARLAPSDPSIAHGRAQVALEAGVNAVAFFEQANRFAGVKSDILLGLAAARAAAGRGDEAAAELEKILTQAPLWIQGHVQLAQLRATLGRPELATASIEHALARLPGEADLWRCLCDLHLKREDYPALGACVARATAAGQGSAVTQDYSAIVAAETGDVERADALFASAASDLLAVWQVRHLLRTRRFAEASWLIDQVLETDRAPAIWPYAATAWRLTGDPRSAWLEVPGSVAFVDLRKELPALDRLAALLRSLHRARGEYLDQSVRGGTQTDGPLLSRIEPDIRILRAAIVGAVQQYLDRLPPVDPSHPLLGPRRDRRIRFAGSWSVRLRGHGHHANHVHPQGWISSALYIALPDRQPGDHPHAGSLSLGVPQAELGLDLPPAQMIAPRPGYLALFPSWLWHGTHSFPAGERLTVAFDVAPPR
ncbi:hypothetical protein C7I55_05695 [Sphingomonas deserti]|uniref:Tetratricopeptide repeat protein n=1 Tax=Allosphingosinicella deserti TaxID=2116704 RepID=A0A2P7QWE8_9SPHN|nr:hypothetical protein C7I55_05695 [Sphingomonas deserti]